MVRRWGLKKVPFGGVNAMLMPLLLSPERKDMTFFYDDMTIEKTKD